MNLRNVTMSYVFKHNLKSLIELLSEIEEGQDFFETEIEVNGIAYEITFLPKKIVREESD